MQNGWCTGTTRDTLIRSLIICASFPFCVWDSCQFRLSNGARKTVITRSTITPRSSHNLTLFFFANAREMKGVARKPCFLRLKMAIYVHNRETFRRLARCQLLWQTFAPVEFQVLKVCTRVWSPGTRWKFYPLVKSRFYSMLMRLHRKNYSWFACSSDPFLRDCHLEWAATFSKKSGRLAEESVENAFRRNSNRSIL